MVGLVDEWLPILSTRIAAINMHTKGLWTGQSGVPPFSLSNHIEKFHDIYTQLQEINNHTILNDEDIEYISDYNKNFLLLILSNTINDENLIHQVQDYLQLNLRLLIKIIKDIKDIPISCLELFCHILAHDKKYYNLVHTNLNSHFFNNNQDNDHHNISEAYSNIWIIMNINY